MTKYEKFNGLAWVYRTIYAGLCTYQFGDSLEKRFCLQ